MEVESVLVEASFYVDIPSFKVSKSHRSIFQLFDLYKGALFVAIVLLE